MKWSNKATCNNTDKWKIQWNSKKDYSIDSSLSFRGAYLEVVVQLFNLYKKAESPLYADVYKIQCLIIINDTDKEKKKRR